MDEQTREAHQQAFENGLATLPEAVAEKARKDFPGSADCYRMKDDPGHYFLIAFVPPYSFPEFDSPHSDQLTAIVLHGTDSFSPGDVAVYVPLSQLVICDCGKWEMPEGIEITDYELEMPPGAWN